MSYLVSSITSTSTGAARGGFGFSFTISSASRSPFVELSTYNKTTALSPTRRASDTTQTTVHSTQTHQPVAQNYKK